MTRGSGREREAEAKKKGIPKDTNSDTVCEHIFVLIKGKKGKDEKKSFGKKSIERFIGEKLFLSNSLFFIVVVVLSIGARKVLDSSNPVGKNY